MLSFSNSSALSSGFLPTTVVQLMLYLCPWFLCGFLNSVLLFIWSLWFSVWKHSGILSRPCNLHHISFLQKFIQTWSDTGTAPDFLNVRTFHDLPDHRVHKHIKKRNDWHATLFCQSCALLLCIPWRWFLAFLQWGKLPIEGCSHVCFPPQWSFRGQGRVEAFQCNAP